MASKSVKKTTTTTTVTRSGGSSERQSPGGRPPSPARITRVQEKEQLINLNDRLANYIDKVRFLEAENSRLAVQVRSCEETTTREVTNIKALYEQELGDARKLLDELSKEKARLQIEVGKYKSEAEDWMIKHGKKERALNDANKKISALEAQVAELEARTLTAENEKKRYQTDYTSLKSEVGGLQRQLTANKKQLEEETLLRVDLENRVQSLKEELAFKGQVHEQELNETRTRTEITMEEIDGQVQQQYESKLADALRDMRAQQDYQIKLHREEIESMYESKINDMRLMSERDDNAVTSSREEMIIAKKRVDELSAELAKLRNQNAVLESRVSELEKDLQRERDYSAAALAQKQEEVKRLRQEIVDMMQEYKDLMDVKIALDNEIAAYRKLLEGEEERLNISGEGTPQRTPVRSGKRKRMAVAEEEYTQTHSSSGFAAQSSAKGGVEVFETDTEGKFIKLFNNSEKDIALGGWTLKHTVGDQETTYKFHRTMNLKAGQYVTVWSANSDVNHSPPHDLVMKGQRWFVGDSMKSVLADSSAEEMAAREMTKSTMRTQYTRTRGGRDVVDAQGDPNRDGKCVIM